MSTELLAKPPSIIEGMPMAEYQARPEVSSHDLMLIHKAPFAYRYAKDNPEEDEDMRLGTLAHLAILEPDLLEASVVIVPEDAPRRPNKMQLKALKEGRGSPKALAAESWWKDFDAASVGKSNVSAKDLEKVTGMHKSLMATRNVRDAIQLPGLVEAVGLFSHHGIDCRMRPDLWADEDVIDLKSTSDCQRRAFSAEIYRQGYHRQASFYVHGARALGRPVKQFIWVTVETKPPFLCNIHATKADSVMIGMGEVDNYRALMEYEKCMKSGYWPGVRQHSEEIELPTYAE